MTFESLILTLKDPILTFKDPILTIKDLISMFESPILAYEKPILTIKDQIRDFSIQFWRLRVWFRRLRSWLWSYTISFNVWGPISGKKDLIFTLVKYSGRKSILLWYKVKMVVCQHWISLSVSGMRIFKQVIGKKI